MINNTFCIQFKDQVSEYYQFNACSISNDEQYLAYGGTEGILKIYDIKQAKIIKEIMELKELRDTLENIQIQACQITFDSQQLFIAIGKFVIGYESKDFNNHSNHKYIRSVFMQQEQYQIKIQSLLLQTKLQQKQIQKVVIKYSNQLINVIYIRSNIVILMILLQVDWQIIQQKYGIEKSHPNLIFQIQLIDNNMLLSLDVWNNLYKWRIDLAQRDLIKIQEFVDPNKILNFYFYQNSQNLLLICSNYIKILDNQGEAIVKIDHQAGEQFPSRDSRQIESARYIHIRSANNIIMLAKAQDAIMI